MTKAMLLTTTNRQKYPTVYSIQMCSQHYEEGGLNSQSCAIDVFLMRMYGATDDVLLQVGSCVMSTGNLRYNGHQDAHGEGGVWFTTLWLAVQAEISF